MVFNAVIKVCLLLTFIIRRVIANDNERQFQQTIARKKKSQVQLLLNWIKTSIISELQ